MKKYFGIKDFLLGFLLATLLFVLMGAAPQSSSVGRYQVSAARDYYVVIDSLTGRARHSGERAIVDWAAHLAK